jgi:flavodoxin
MTAPNKVLVVYFSRTGHTAALAQAIARERGWPIARIEEATSRQGWWGYVRSAISALLGQSVPIRYDGPPPESFDLVVIGGPVWVSKIAAPALSFATQHAKGLKSVALFCTYGGSGANQALAGLAQVCSLSPVAQLALTEAVMTSDTFASPVKDFVKRINPLPGNTSSTAVPTGT